MKKVLLIDISYRKKFDVESTVDYNFINKFAELSHKQILFSGAICMPRQQLPNWYHTGFDYSIPDYKQYNTTSFKDATDIRSKQMQDYYANDDLPIVVYWSGGIDSTVIMSAIHKNFTPEMKDRVVVVMNTNSYTENPNFFKKIIEPNYKFINKTDFDFRNSHILHGDPADSLWLQGNILNMENPFKFIEDDISVSTNFVEFYQKKGISESDANWYKDFFINDAKKANVNLTSTADLLWWSNFVCHSTQSTCKYIYTMHDFEWNKNVIDLYFRNATPWFLSKEYQVWSIQDQKNKFDGTVQSYKMSAKEYIYEVDKNEYYRDYKTKMTSLSSSARRYSFLRADIPYISHVLYNDGTYDIDN